MKEFPVGSICTIVVSETYPELVGEEVTIIEGLKMRASMNHRTGNISVANTYIVDIKLPDAPAECLTTSTHDKLKLKRFPGELHNKCTEFVNKLLTKQPNLVTEDV